MINELKPYAAMKDSGYPWLGEVPDHWDVLPNRALFVEIKDREHPDEEMLSVTITRGVVRQSALLAESAKKDSSNLDRSAYKLVQPNDIAYNKMRAWQGAIGASSLRGIVSPAYVVMRPRDKSIARYFHELFRTPMFAKEAERWSYGITSDMWSLRSEHFKMIYSVIPPLEERMAIVRFLSHADGQIHRYVRAKQKLIQLLDEQKQATIHRAIIRGVDPEVHLRSCGVEWLGDVPNHWQVKLLHHLLDPAIPLAYGILLPGPRLDEGVPYLGAGDVRSDRLRLDVLPRTTPEIAAAYPRTRMRAGELVYAIRGSFGSVEVIPPELDGVNLSRDAARLAPRSNVNAFWLALALRSRLCQEQFKLKEIGATITGVNIRDLKRVVLPVPPNEEQAAIVRFLETETSAVDGTIRTAEREISLLREYRTRLVTDVVTGKLDVREAAARLPQETPESKLDEIEDIPEDEETAAITELEPEETV